jgi:hypothetical protein
VRAKVGGGGGASRQAGRLRRQQSHSRALCTATAPPPGGRRQQVRRRGFWRGRTQLARGCNRCTAEAYRCLRRFDLKLYQIKLGTLEQAHAENEWVLRAYTRNTKRSKLADKEADE